MTFQVQNDVKMAGKWTYTSLLGHVKSNFETLNNFPEKVAIAKANNLSFSATQNDSCFLEIKYSHRFWEQKNVRICIMARKIFSFIFYFCLPNRRASTQFATKNLSYRQPIGELPHITSSIKTDSSLLKKIKVKKKYISQKQQKNNFFLLEYYEFYLSNKCTYPII